MYSYDRTAGSSFFLGPKDPVDKAVKRLKAVASKLDLAKSMPASAANSLERREQMDHHKAWSALDDGEKKKVLTMINDLTEAADDVTRAGQKLWNWAEGR